MQHSETLRILLVAKRRFSEGYADYLYDPLVDETPKLIDGLGTYDKILYWDKSLEAAKLYWNDRHAWGLLNLAAERFGFDELHELVAFRNDKHADIEFGSTQEKTTARTVARFMKLTQPIYMKKLIAAHVTEVADETRPGSSSTSESSNSKRPVDAINLEDEQGNERKRSRLSKADGEVAEEVPSSGDSGDESTE